MIVRSAALAAFVLSTTVSAQSQADSARAALKAQLEGVRAPMFGGGAPLPGVTATYSVATTGCRTRVEISLPAYSYGGSNHAGRIEQVALAWASVREVRTSGSYAIVFAPGLPERGRYFYAGSTAGASRLKGAMDTLVRACSSAAVPGVPLAERMPEKPDVLGAPQCRFRAIPELLLTDNKPPVVKSAVYRVMPREGGKESRFAVGLQPGDTVSNWQGVLAQPQIVLDHPAHLETQVTRAAILVDGRPIAISVRPRHAANQYPGLIPGRFSSTVGVSPATYDPGGLLAAIAGGSAMVVRLYAGSRQLSQWTFDVQTLRHVPAALKGARWTCG